MGKQNRQQNRTENREQRTENRTRKRPKRRPKGRERKQASEQRLCSRVAVLQVSTMVESLLSFSSSPVSFFSPSNPSAQGKRAVWRTDFQEKECGNGANTMMMMMMMME